ncbi:MAG: 5-(carboxyamino)imidazole ribonucleotide mutase, partial [Candidatus Micrarchaeota archaeon]|nr:5-(carboxyamino)imidazole ribonucleotide mutase [Candidatus Micrarchaeota archaeon]
LEFCQKIGKSVSEFGITPEYRIASAHRTPQDVLKMAEDANKEKGPVVFIAVAGLSNALSGMLACATSWPIVSCPPGDVLEDVWSSIRMPPGVAHATVIGAQNAALYAVKILAASDAGLRKKADAFLAKKGETLRKDDAATRS